MLNEVFLEMLLLSRRNQNFPHLCRKCKQVKVAVNTRLLLPGKMEGIHWFSWEVLKRLVEWYPQHEFLFLFDRPYDPRFAGAPNVTPLVLWPPARHPLLYMAWFEGAVARVLRKYQPDCFFSPEWFLSLRSTVPATIVVHDLGYLHFPEHLGWSTRTYYQFFVPRFVAKAHRVLTVSEYSKQDLQLQLGVEAEKVQVICNGCREGFRPLEELEIVRAREQYSEGKPYFCYVGSIHPRKNIARLIRAFDLFKNRTGAPHQLVIGGKWGWKYGEVEAALQEVSSRSSIHFPGYIAEDDLPRFMGGSEGMLYPSLFEGFGIPILEAFHAEVPVLTSNTSSMPEVAGPAGLLVDPNDIRSIAEGIQILFENTAQRDQLIKSGRVQRQRFSWDIAAEGVASALGLGQL